MIICSYIIGFILTIFGCVLAFVSPHFWWDVVGCFLAVLGISILITLYA